MTLKAQETKAKIDRWDYIKLYQASTQQRLKINRMKSQLWIGRKYLQTTKGLMFKIHKELIQLKSKNKKIIK